MIGVYYPLLSGEPQNHRLHKWVWHGFNFIWLCWDPSWHLLIQNQQQKHQSNVWKKSLGQRLWPKNELNILGPFCNSVTVDAKIWLRNHPNKTQSPVFILKSEKYFLQLVFSKRKKNIRKGMNQNYWLKHQTLK